MKRSIQLSQLDGYDEILESEREKKFKKFLESDDPAERKDAMGEFALITAARSKEFISSLESAIGIPS